LRTALAEAESSATADTIVLYPGHYLLNSPLSYTDNGSAGALTITVMDPADPPVLDGQGTSSILAVKTDQDYNDSDAGCDISIGRIIFQNSDPNEQAVTINTSQAAIQISNCLFQDNQYKGLALMTHSGPITVEQNTFKANGGTFGAGAAGGMYIETQSGPITVTGNTFQENRSNFEGGGSFILSSATTGVGEILIRDNLFVDNEATISYFSNGNSSYGGGLYCFSHGSVQVIGNTFTGNNAESYSGVSYGGGASIIGREVELTNNIFTGNSATVAGAYYLYEPSTGECQFRGINNTVYNNKGGDWAVTIQYYSVGCTAVLTNNIFWDESEREGVAYANDGGGTLLLSYNILGREADPETGQSPELYINNTTNYTHVANRTGTDPLLLNDGHLRTSSPAVNTGICGEINGMQYTRIAPYDDIDGDTRPGEGILFGCDVGADEHYGFAWNMFVPAIIHHP
jgi:hypothetical protein